MDKDAATSAKSKIGGKWLPLRLAEKQAVMNELRDPSRFGSQARINLIYPGCGCDFTSFWKVVDPSTVLMVDPWPVQCFPSPFEGMAECKREACSQLKLPTDTFMEDFVFDMTNREVRRLTPHETATQIGADLFGRNATLRLAFSFMFELDRHQRNVTFIGVPFHEIGTLQELPLSSMLSVFNGIGKSHVVYEHKSMILTGHLEDRVAPGGCLIWGLPDYAPNVQWSTPPAADQ